MDAVEGTDADDTINAPVTSPTTGAEATTVQSLDVIKGGAGKDTLNITSTADFNKSLTGLTVSGVEVVNITGANNLATIATVPAAAVAGAKQVQVLDIGNLSLEAEQQTVSYVGLAKSATAGTLAISVLGQTVTTASVAADASAATVATAIATAINASTAVVTGTSTVKDLVSASATSGVVTLKFAASVGDAVATTQGTTGLVTALTPNLTAPTITDNAVASSAEIQSVTLDVSTAGVAGNTLTFANLGSTILVVTLVAAVTADATGEAALALAVKTAVDAAITADATSVSNIARVEQVNDKLTFFYKASAGDVAPLTATYAAGAGAAAFAGTATNATITEVRKGGEVDFTVTVNGAQYAVNNVVVSGDILSATSATALAAQNASKEALRSAIDGQLKTVIGEAIAVGTSDQAGEIKLTSNTVGTVVPTITATGRDSASNLISVDAADAATVANVVKTNATAVAQQVQYTFGGTVEAADGFTLYINGTNFGTLLAGVAAAPTPTTIAAQFAGAVNAVLGAGVAVANAGTVTITAPTAGTALPVISVTEIDTNAGMTFVRADVRENATGLGTTTSTTTAAAVAAATTFADATEVNLSGSSNAASVTAAAGQTIGFSGVTSMANTVTFAGTNAAIASTGSSGALTLAGAALVSASLAGTTAGTSTAPLALTDGNTTASIKALTVTTTGATEISTIGMTALTSVTQTGAGALTINRADLTSPQAQNLASITTAAGADQVRIGTKTAADLVDTTIIETVNASVSTGDGGDRVVVATTGSGKTTVDLGAGNDTLILSGIGTGVNSLSGGAGNDAFRITTISTLGTTTISGGSDTDTLRTSTDTFTFADYTTLTANVSSVETLQLTAAAALDASKVGMSRIEFLATGTNTVTEVSSSQALAAVRTPVSSAGFGIAAVTASVAVHNITAASKGYLVDSDATLAGQQTVFGDNLNISMTHVREASGGSTVVAKGNALDLSVTALAATTGATSTTNVAELNSQVTVSGDIQTLNAALTSARGSGTSTDLLSTSLGDEAIAKLVVNGVVLDDTQTSPDEGNLDNLTSIKVSGAGDVTINAGSLAKEVAKLKSIDLSNMTAFADTNELGQEVSSGGTAGGFNNLSKSSVTLNNAISETVILGGGRDTVVTGSTVAITDTVTGFQLTASAADPLVVDLNRSDVLNIGGGTFVKMTTTATSLSAALLEAANLVVGGAPKNDVVFNFGGDTYVFRDLAAGGTSVAGLDDGDRLVKLSGTLNLDLLLQANVII